MRDLVFKNITSDDRHRKVLASSEVTDSDGTHSAIHRHFICIVKEVKSTQVTRPLPYAYILRKRDTRNHEEKFFCRIKGSLYAVNKGRVYLILFMHSLKITLASIAQGVTP